MIFRLPKYCVKIKTKAMQASSPSCMPNGSINIINIIVTTQFITERASPHILFFRSPIAPMIRITPKIAPINKIIYRLSWKYWSLKEKYCPMSNLPEPKISAGRAHKTPPISINPPCIIISIAAILYFFIKFYLHFYQLNISLLKSEYNILDLTLFHLFSIRPSILRISFDLIYIF